MVENEALTGKLLYKLRCCTKMLRVNQNVVGEAEGVLFPKLVQSTKTTAFPGVIPRKTPAMAITTRPARFIIFTMPLQH